MQRTLAVQPEILFVFFAGILRLWLPVRPLPQELAPVPVKSAVFDDGLLRVASTAVGTL